MIDGTSVNGATKNQLDVIRKAHRGLDETKNAITTLLGGTHSNTHMHPGGERETGGVGG